MIRLKKEQQESHEKTKICYICKKLFKHNFINDKTYRKVKDHCSYNGKYIGAAHSICNLKYSISQEISLIFHNGLKYNYHFIIKELPKEFEEEFNLIFQDKILRKCKTFPVPITKGVKNIGRNGKKVTKTTS